MNSTDIMVTLRRQGIAVLHAVGGVTTPGGHDLTVVFLECTYGQADEARDCLARVPGVVQVSFARHTRGIMYVVSEQPP